MLWGSLITAAQLGTALVVETGSPDAMCPDLTQTRDAVAMRLGTLSINDSGWTLRYTIGHSPDSRSGDFVRLELWDPRGTLRLERNLPLHSGSCATMAQAIAVVVDRFFRSLAQQEAAASEAMPAEKPRNDAPRTPDRSDSLRPPGPAAGSRDSEHDPERAIPVSPTAGASASATETLKVGLLGSYLIESFGAQITFEAPLGNRIHLGLSSAIPMSGPSDTVEGRSVSLRSYSQRVWLALGKWSSSYWVDTGPELLAVVEQADGGDLIGGKSATRLIPGVGVSLGCGARVSARFGFGLRAGIDITHPPLARQFVVTTKQGTEEVLAAPRFRAAAGAGIFFSF